MYILDCTLRDGGYYNAWDFETSLVQRYLSVMHEAGIDRVEIGFRFAPQDTFIGPYGYSSDAWLHSLKVPQGLKLGLMCNAKDLLSRGSPEETVGQMFAPARESPVDLVRIAAHFKEAPDCPAAIGKLHDLGYRVGLNLMQAGGRSEDELGELISGLADTPVEVIYFADSLGSMTADEVSRTVAVIKQNCDKEIGFHAHDNMGQALANAWAAYEAGATWIDGTVLGMGRGAGNLRIEYWLLELVRRGLRSTNLDPLLALVTEEFGELQQRYGWGPSLFYHLSAIYGVHPTYVQEMLADERYSQNEVITALQRLGETGAPGYNQDRLRMALEAPPSDCAGDWDASAWLKGQSVILVAPGQSGRAHRDGLMQLLERRPMPVLCLNSNAWLPDHAVTAWIACNPQRIAMDQRYYAERSGRLIAPKPIAEKQLGEAAHNWQIFNYGLEVNTGHFIPHATGATLPAPLAALYGLGVANAAGASRIYMVGFDGYDRNDPRHHEMEEALNAYYAYENAAPLLALTPSKLDITQHSLYAPDI